MNMGFVLLHTAVSLYEFADSAASKRMAMFVFAAIFCSCLFVIDMSGEELIAIGSILIFLLSALQIRIINKLSLGVPLTG